MAKGKDYNYKKKELKIDSMVMETVNACFNGRIIMIFPVERDIVL